MRKKIEKVWMSNLWVMSFWLNLPCKSVCRYGCCSNFWELLAWRKIMKILRYIINIIIMVLIKFYRVWSCIFKDMDFLTSLSCFRIKFRWVLFNLWELWDWNKIPKILIKIPLYIFQFPLSSMNFGDGHQEIWIFEIIALF